MAGKRGPQNVNDHLSHQSDIFANLVGGSDLQQMVGEGRVGSDLKLTQCAKVFNSSKSSVFYAKFTWVPIPLKLHSCKKSENLEGRAQKEIVKVFTNIQSR